MMTSQRFVIYIYTCTSIWLEESQEWFQVSYDLICMYVGIVHTAAAELVVWGYHVYPAQQIQPGPTHRVSVFASCPPAKKGSRRRRKPLTTNLVRG